MQLPRKLMAARFKTIQQWPYLASAMWAIVPVEADLKGAVGFSTLAVDQWWRLYYDAEAVEKWSVPELSGVLYHEINHLLRHHHKRAEVKVAHPTVWNIAGDLEINSHLKKEQVVLPRSGVYPDQYKDKKGVVFPEGQLVEWYYEALLRDHFQVIQVLMEGPDGGAPGNGQPGGGGKKGQKPGEGGSGGPDSLGPSHGGCGSCAGGGKRPWELGPPSEHSPGIREDEADIIRVKIAQDISDRIRSGKDRGTMPGHWQRWAEQTLSPRIDWRKVIGGLVRRAISDVAGCTDYSYRRPSRRQNAVPDVVMPSMRHPIPQVAAVVDTSGSMSNKEIGLAVAEVGGLLTKLGLRDGLQCLAVDAELHTCRKVFNPKQVKLAGGGGTDMGVGIHAAAKLRPKPNCCVVLTDGYTPWPEQAPAGMKIVICVINDREPDGWKLPSYARAVFIPTSAFEE